MDSYCCFVASHYDVVITVWNNRLSSRNWQFLADFSRPHSPLNRQRLLRNLKVFLLVVPYKPRHGLNIYKTDKLQSTFTELMNSKIQCSDWLYAQVSFCKPKRIYEHSQGKAFLLNSVIIYWNRSLTYSDLFTKSTKLSTFHCHISKSIDVSSKAIFQIDRKWLFPPFSNFCCKIWVDFCLMKTYENTLS